MTKEQKEVQQAYLSEEKKVIRQLKQVYSRAAKDCEDRIAALNARTDMQNLQAIVYQKQYQEALKKQIDGILDTLQTEDFETISEYLTASYENGYAGAMYDLHSQGIPVISPINQNQVVKAVETDSKISTNLYTRLGEDVDYLKNSIRDELSRGTASGASWLEIAQNIASGMNNPFDSAMKRAVRIARTEGHRIQNEAQLDALEAAKDNGADIVKQWDSTLDSRTRPDHREADGQIVELDEYFVVGGERMKAPGVGGSARQVCNCRCCLLQRARWALDEDELETLKEKAEFHGLDKTADFEEFKKKYLQAAGEGDTIDEPNGVIEQTLGVKLGSAADTATALANANVDHGRSGEYSINCQRCVQAYELQRRGYDVTAVGKPSSGNTIKWGTECFTRNGTSDEAYALFTMDQTATGVERELSNAPDGSRYVIYVQWKKKDGGGAHVFVAEKANGTVQYLDPQTGDTDTSRYFAHGSRNKFGYCRVDDKQITANSNAISNTVRKR